MARSSGRDSIRLRAVSFVTLLALVGALSMSAAASTATASSDSSNRPIEYLALGDSLAFGYSPLVSPMDADNFVGYPDTVADLLRMKLTNASCPGETSSHFVSLTGSDFGCGDFRFGTGTIPHPPFPLHAAYTTAQLAFVDTFLQSHPKTLVISLDIGANDLQSLVETCGGPILDCVQPLLPGVLATYAANLDTIYGHIRNTDGYRHKIVAMTVYSPNYGDPQTTAIIAMVNQVLVDRTLAWGGIVADGFGAFAAASFAFGGDSCAAGLRIVTSTSPLVCDNHPSPAGRDLLATTIVQALRID